MAAREIQYTKRCGNEASMDRCVHEWRMIAFARQSCGGDVRRRIVHCSIRRSGTRCTMTSIRWSSMTWREPHLDWCGFLHQRHRDASDEDSAGHVPCRRERASGEVSESLNGELGRTAEDRTRHGIDRG